MTKGIFLCAFGKRGYGFAAFNFALSIKHFNPNIKIALFYDPKTFSQVDGERMRVFDILIPIPEDLLRNDPATIKVNCYEYLPFDYNLFLDVDALCLKDLEKDIDELINKGGYYYSHVVGKHTIDMGNEIPTMLWAWANDIWQHFELSHDAVLPAINSSFQFIKRCPESMELFEQVKSNINNPIPTERLRMRWGGGQPDELYMNIALAQKEINADSGKEYLFLGSFHRSMPFDLMQRNYSILSLFGNGSGKSLTPLRFIEWYDRQMMMMCRQKGMEHIFKVHHIMQDKHANKTTASVRPSMPQTSDEPLVSIIVPCKRRLQHVKKAFPSLLTQTHKNIEIVFVDYNCPENSGEWIRRVYKDHRIKIVSAKVGPDEWNLSAARNLGYKNSNGKILLFLDADSVIHKSFISEHIKALSKDVFLSGRSYVPYQCSGCCMLWRGDFEKVKGYNEVVEGWGTDDLELYKRLENEGIKQQLFKFSLIRNIPHPDNIRNEFYGGKAISETNHHNWELTEKEFKGI